MTTEAIGEELAGDPFVLLRLFGSDGHSYEVHRPGRCLIVRGILYLARTDRPSRISDDMDVIDCAHVTRIEQADDAVAQRPVLSRK